MSESFDTSLHESLSALQDGETTTLETRRLLKNLDDRPELREQWRRHQLIGAALRRESTGRYEDISESVRDAVADTGTGSAAWRRPLQQIAAAASVAAVTLVAIQFLPGEVGIEQSAAPDVAENLYDDGPMVQFPAGLDLPTLAARTVSAGPVQPEFSSGALMLPQPLVTEPNLVTLPAYDRTALRRHFDATLFQHNSNTASATTQPVVPLARVPGLESPQP